jgi:hypothetical protein
MDRVDELNQEAIKFNRFQQQVIRQQQDKHRFLQKRVIVATGAYVFGGGGGRGVNCLCFSSNNTITSLKRVPELFYAQKINNLTSVWT